MELSQKQKKYLRRLAHALRPLVMLGNAGLTDAVAAELDRTLSDHELVKVSVRVGEREARTEALETLATRTSSVMIQRVGHVAVFYRRRPDSARIMIPD